VEELERLQVRLQEEVDARDRERQTHTLELQAKAEDCRRAESLEAELHQEIAVTRTQLDQTQAALQALEAEKSALQIETTDLGAEIQRTVSLNRFMEGEIKAW
jgi:chromosome segregation ATPase